MMMSGVVAKAGASQSERCQVLIKGAPYEVTQLADPDSLPDDWAQVRYTHFLLIQKEWQQVLVQTVDGCSDLVHLNKAANRQQCM